MNDRDEARRKLIEMYEEFTANPPPKGVGPAADDAQIDVDEYDGYISGLVQSFLAGNPVDVGSINDGGSTTALLEAAEAKLTELRSHFDRERALARQLIECLTPSDERHRPQ